MKTRKSKYLVIVLGLFFIFSCSTNEYVRVQVEMPRKMAVNLDDFEEIAITHFWVAKEAEDFDINKEIRNYFSIELDQKMDKKISSPAIVIENEEVFQDADFWKEALPDKKGTLLFTGSLDYTQEVRKAIKSARKRQFEQPFPEESRIEQRRFYSLSLRLYFIDAQSGETVYERTFKESKAYKNPNQTAYFAFYDMLLNVRDKLFRQILGGEQIQERYLIK
jgi:hypothetical protein